MQITIAILYAIFFSWALTKIAFIKKAKIDNALLISIFYLKIIVGLVYAYLMYQQQIQSGLPTDTWKYFNYSLDETQTLLNNPNKFIHDLFENQYGNNGYTTFWASTGSFWADFKNWCFVKILALFNVVTYNNYAANLVIINFLSFFGWVAIYKTLTQILNFKKWPALLIVFLIPSTLFWNSGLHKDAFIFNSIGCIIWLVMQPLSNNKKIPLLLLHLFIIFCFRYYTLIFLCIGLAGYYAYSFLKIKARQILLGYFSLVLILILASPWLHPALSIPQIFRQKQQEFLLLQANSDFKFSPVALQPLQFLAQAPKALGNMFATPNFNQLKGASTYISFIEIFIILILSAISIIKFIYFKKYNSLLKPQILFILFAVLFVFTAAFTIGYINVNIGSIARYRSILLPVILAVALMVIMPKKIIRL
jgi:hypothetical protein